MNEKAFTLAEVLITLGIIGVVAAMILPAVINGYKEKMTVRRLEEAYSRFSNVYTELLNEYGSPIDWPTVDKNENENQHANRIMYNFRTKMKVVKQLDYSINTDRQGKDFLGKGRGNVYWPDGVTQDGHDNIGNGYRSQSMLVNGMYFDIVGYNLFIVDGVNTYCGSSAKSAFPCFYLWVKTDNANRVIRGKNYFQFIAYTDKLVPSGIPGFPNFGNCKRNNNGTGCAGWVIVNKNLDYLHCDDLDWNTKTKCK